ncbi:MAG: SLC13 family permease [Saezia sp.]
MSINYELLWVLSLLLCAIVLFTTNKVRMDVVAFIMIVAFVLSGTLSAEEALAGFSDQNVILIAALFVIGEGLVSTGIAYQVGDKLVKAAGNSETKLLVLLMLSIAGLGSVMSSTGVVAIFIPIAMSVSARMSIPPGRLMMPLGFAGLISGMMTLVATPPNMVVSSELVRNGLDGFAFFDVTPVGVLVLLMGVGYMLVARNWIVGKVSENKSDGGMRLTMRDLIRDYKLAGKARLLAIHPGSPLIGRTLEELHLRSRYGAYVIGIERWRKFRRVMVSALSSTKLKEYDVLLVDMSDPEADVRQFCTNEMLEPRILRGEYFSEQAREVGMAEVSLVPESELLGKTLRQITFRTRYNLNVISIRRNNEVLAGNLLDEELMIRDTFLVAGDWKYIKQLQSYTKDFLMPRLPVEVDDVAPAMSQAPYALICLALMVGLMVFGIVPNAIAAILACLLMGKFRCIDMESAYKAIHWPTLILIVGMLPFATALNKTGGIDLAVSGLISIVGDGNPYFMLLSLFILCAIIGLFISNTATAVLMAPIGIATAQQMGVSPYPFAMIIAIAASAAFMTPVSSPVNTMVLAPGGYKFSDYLKVGVPFTLLVMVVSVIVVPLLFPFYPRA